ncbi:MAG: hypothetical protein ACI4F4_03020 [Lachnospiraceae bacterium]
MDMNGIANVQSSAGVYTGYQSTSGKKEKESVENSVEQGAVYEKSEQNTEKPATYSINKMSKEERDALVTQLKEDQAARQESLVNLVKQMMGKQADVATIAGDFGNLSEEEEASMWKFIASGKYTVDEATKKQAQEDIAEDGYWGVKQTSQRLFDFASALAGDDVDKMKEMQSAMEKGFKEATKLWGKDLPQLSQDTLKAANQLFDDYYASKNQPTDVQA